MTAPFRGMVIVFPSGILRNWSGCEENVGQLRDFFDNSSPLDLVGGPVGLQNGTNCQQMSTK